MRLFKYIITTLLLVVIVAYFCNKIVTTKSSMYQKTIDNLYTVNEKGVCASDNIDNFTKIAKSEGLIYQYGDQVIDEVSKNFTNPLIPSTYKISAADLEQGHALLKEQTMILTVLEFKDQEKFDKVSEFFTLGQVVIGYELKIDDELNIIMISFDFDNLDYYSKLFYDQKCY